MTVTVKGWACKYCGVEFWNRNVGVCPGISVARRCEKLVTRYEVYERDDCRRAARAPAIFFTSIVFLFNEWRLM